MKKIITIVLIVGVISLVGIASVKAYAHHNNDYNCSNCYDNNLVKHNCSNQCVEVNYHHNYHRHGHH